jgi:ABC-type polar amino acid transport system ATPase subunit
MGIQVENLTKYYGETPVLNNLFFEVENGSLVSIIGPSGSGKSTLLRCLNALELAQEGLIKVDEIEINNGKCTQKTINSLRKIVGMVFQSYNLFPYLTLLDNLIKAPVVVLKTPAEKARADALVLLEKVGLSSHAEKYPAQLSGGQAQRGAIARALMMKPKIMLYDEPTSALDPEWADEVLMVMKQLHSEDKITQIVVGHEMHFIKRASDEVIFMDHGKIIERGIPEKIFSNKSDPRIQKFLQRYL